MPKKDLIEISSNNTSPVVGISQQQAGTTKLPKGIDEYQKITKSPSLDIDESSPIVMPF
jgi:hypothetical protein